MAIVYAHGWELGAAYTFYTGAGWTKSGTATTNDVTQTMQHPDGYASGSRSLKLASSAYLTMPTASFTLSGSATLSSGYYAGAYTADEAIIGLLDDSGNVVAGIYAADNSASTSRLTLKHNGSTVATTTAYFNASQWYRLVVSYALSGSTITLKLYVDGTLYAEGSSSTVLSNATRLRWGNSSTSSASYHDQTAVYNTTTSETLDDIWIVGLEANSDVSIGSWIPKSPATTVYSQMDASDVTTYAEAGVATAFELGAQGRLDISVNWLNPEVRGVVTSVAVQKGSGLNDAIVSVELGTEVNSTSYTLSNYAVIQQVSPDKPNQLGLAGTPASLGWAASDIGNIKVKYSVS